MNLIQICLSLPVHGQLIVCLIVLFSVVTVAVIIDRLFCFRRTKLNPGRAMAGIEPLLRNDRILEAVSLCDKNSRPITRIIKAGILKHDKGPDRISRAMAHRMDLELAPLEKYLYLLASMAYIAPLLGFAGTVLGMMDVFFRVHASVEFLSPGDLAAGTGEAMLTTAAGLAVAIPSILANNYFRARIEHIKTDLERLIAEVTSLLQGRT